MVELLNQAGVGRYRVGGQFGERVPKAGSELFQVGVEVREAIAELTYGAPGDEALTKKYNSALKALRAALEQARVLPPLPRSCQSLGRSDPPPLRLPSTQAAPSAAAACSDEEEQDDEEEGRAPMLED